MPRSFSWPSSGWKQPLSWPCAHTKSSTCCSSKLATAKGKKTTRDMKPSWLNTKLCYLGQGWVALIPTVKTQKISHLFQSTSVLALGTPSLNWTRPCTPYCTWVTLACTWHMERKVRWNEKQGETRRTGPKNAISLRRAMDYTCNIFGGCFECNNIRSRVFDALPLLAV